MLLRVAVLLAVLVTPQGLRADSRSDCSFYRNEARGQGLGHFATEALWACETVAQRRRAGMPLGDRLSAVAYALDRFEAAMNAERAARYPRTGGPGIRLRDARELTRELVAEESGMLYALEAIRTGF